MRVQNAPAKIIGKAAGATARKSIVLLLVLVLVIEDELSRGRLRDLRQRILISELILQCVHVN
jgi:hypothetical protein